MLGMLGSLGSLFGGKAKKAPVIDTNSAAYKNAVTYYQRALADTKQSAIKRQQALAKNPERDQDWRLDPQAVASRIIESHKPKLSQKRTGPKENNVGKKTLPVGQIVNQGGMQNLGGDANVTNSYSTPTSRGRPVPATRGSEVGYAAGGLWKANPSFGGMDPNRHWGSSIDYSKGRTAAEATLLWQAAQKKKAMGTGYSSTRQKIEAGKRSGSAGWSGSGWLN